MNDTTVHIVVDQSSHKALDTIKTTLKAQGLRASRSDCFRYAVMRTARELASNTY